jgi:lysine 2,3-aminomutase
LHQLQVLNSAEGEQPLWAAALPDAPHAAIAAEPATRLNPGAYPTSTLAPVSYRRYYYPDTVDEDWNDWRWQFRNRITTLSQWNRFFPLAAAERDVLRQVMREFRLGLTPYYLSLIDPHDPADPMRLQSAPSTQEFINLFSGDEDPLGEQTTSPVPGIVHRYPDRCLLIATNSCAMYCRYCTRKRLMHEGDAPPDRAALKKMND